MKYKILGQSNIKISAIGLGCMGMSEFYGPTDEQKSINTLQRAIDLGVNFIDTADAYGNGENEKLISKVIKERRHEVVIATKFGITRDPQNPLARIILSNAEYVKKACDASLSRLGIDCIDLYYAHRRDTSVPIEETVGAMAELVKEGKVKYIGLSEANPDTILRAHQVHPISALQTEYSMWHRAPEDKLIPLCEKLGITFVAYSPLGRGFLTGKIKSLADLDKTDFRRLLPRFEEQNLQRNLELVKEIEKLAKELNCTTSQLMLAWEFAQSDQIVPIPGTRQIKYLEENIAATNIHLTQESLDKLSKISKECDIIGNRYYDRGMELIDQ